MARGTLHSGDDTGLTRRRLDPDARRTQLVRLGVEMIKTRPFDQVLIDEVIAAAGISKGLLFHYFPTKRDFQAAVIRAAAQELLAAIEPEPDLPVDEQLRRGLDAYIGYIEQQPASYQAIVRGAGSDDKLLAIFEETRNTVVELVVGRMLGRPSSVLRLAVRGWVAMVEEATFLWLRDRPCSRRRLLEMLERTALQVLPILAALDAAEADDDVGVTSEAG